MVNRLVRLPMFFYLFFMSISCSQVRHFSDVRELSEERGRYADEEVVLDAVLFVGVDGAVKACSSEERNSCIFLVVSTDLYHQLKNAEATHATIYGEYKEHGFSLESGELEMLPSRIVVDDLKIIR